MTLRIWLQEGLDGEPGVAAFGLDFLGFTTWAESEPDVIARIPARFADYCGWRARHGLAVACDEPKVEIVGRFVGDELLLPPDHEPAQPSEIQLAIRLLACSRADLVAQLEAAPEAALDWDPPYRRFASWATWRTIRENLAHIANTETHYYARNVGYEPVSAPADPHGDWRTFLPRSRSYASAFLEGLASSADRCRLRISGHGSAVEGWSVRKALRRLVSHERTHAKSIARILRAHRDAHQAG